MKIMQIEDLLIKEGSTIKEAVKRLEEKRCKVVYVVHEGKLIASISDGDVRRYALKNGEMGDVVKSIANYNPQYLLVYDKYKLDEIFERSEISSIPIVNYNREVVEIVFRNGRRIQKNHNLNCPVVMMAGGKGTRLFPYTKVLPKALIPIGEIPISERIINNFVNYGCRQFYLILNHKRKMIQAYFDALEKPYTIEYVEEETYLGTGGGLCLLNDKINQDFFLVNCDIIIDADYSEIYSYHKKNSNYITIIAAKYKHVVPYGVIDIDENGCYGKLTEKPENNYVINAGMYIVNGDLINTMPQNEEISFPEVIEKCKEQGRKIGVYIIEESAYMDMGQLEEMEKMKNKLQV